MGGVARIAPIPNGARPVIRRGKAMSGYFVTPDGHVWSAKTGRFLRAYDVAGPPPYCGVVLCVDGRFHRATVHQLVAEAFIGPRPPGLDVCHRDGNRKNNRPENLRYGTRSDNLADRDLHGTHQRGERNPSARLTDSQAEEIRARRQTGELLSSLAGTFGVRESTISRIANNKRRAVLSWGG